MTYDRESNEEYDDGYTRDSFERQDEDTEEGITDPLERRYEIYVANAESLGWYVKSFDEWLDS